MSLFPVFLIEVGDIAKQYIEKGLLVPDHVITRLMLLELENRRGEHWLLDGELNLGVHQASASSGSWSLEHFHNFLQIAKCLFSPVISLDRFQFGNIIKKPMWVKPFNSFVCILPSLKPST